MGSRAPANEIVYVLPGSSGCLGTMKARRPDSAGTMFTSIAPSAPMRDTELWLTDCTCTSWEKRRATNESCGTWVAPPAGKEATTSAIALGVVAARGELWI